MTNKEYKEKYGEEALKEYLEKKSEYARAYYAKNRDSIKKKSISSYQNDREKSLDRMKRYNMDHKDELKAYKQKYYLENQDCIKGKSREYSAKMLATMDGRANNLLCGYRQSEKRHNRGECTLTKEWIIEHIFNSSCIYCGETDWRKLGCDRIDESKPHTPENCVCACKKCNTERYYKRLSVDEFKEYTG